jgi:hypothetical protein
VGKNLSLPSLGYSNKPAKSGFRGFLPVAFLNQRLLLVSQKLDSTSSKNKNLEVRAEYAKMGRPQAKTWGRSLFIA